MPPEEHEFDDLMTNDNEEYEPTEPPSDRETGEMTIPEDEVPGAVLVYQNRRSEDEVKSKIEDQHLQLHHRQKCQSVRQ